MKCQAKAQTFPQVLAIPKEIDITTNNHMSTLQSLINDLHKPFSGMLETDWYEGKDHVVKPDIRTDQEIASEQAAEEVFNDHVRD